LINISKNSLDHFKTTYINNTFINNITLLFPNYNLYSIYFAEDVSGIANNIFQYSTIAIVNFDTNISLISLPNYCFSNCLNLKSFTTAKSIISLGSYCFEYCTNLSNVILNKTTTIGSFCFRSTKLISIVFI
jgi:hypothetical protein